MQENEQALAAAREKVLQCRRLLVEQPSEEAYHQLLDSLMELNVPQVYLGRSEDVLATVRESIGVCRTLAATHPGKGLGRLAHLLDLQSDLLNSADRSQEALASAQEAVGLWRSLLEKRPEQVAPHLVNSLIGLGIIQRYLGQGVESLPPLLEAVALSRKLAEQNPEEFLRELAESLSNLGNQQLELGLRREALATLREEVDIHRALAQRHPEESLHLMNLALDLERLGELHRALGQSQQALDAVRELRRLGPRLMKEEPEFYRPLEARFLPLLLTLQRELGLVEEVEVSAREAEGFYRALAEAHPELFHAQLSMGLERLVHEQGEPHQRRAAQATVRELVALLRGRAGSIPERWEEFMARQG